MMSTDNSPHSQRYSRDLMLALRTRNVPSDRIAEVVAEVESHVAETAEDPYESFGSPTAYAAVVAGRPRWNDLRTWGAALLGGLAGWLLAQTVFALVTGEPRLYALPTWVVGTIAIALAGLAAISAHRLYAAVVDPRSGQRRLQGGGWPTVAVLVVSAVLVAALAVLTQVLT